MSRSLSRRDALRTLAATLPLGASAGAVPAGLAQEAAPAPADNPQGVCVLFPQAVEGPYYFDPKLVRADITEGRPGLPIAMIFRVVELPSCKPVEGARVDVWHADASGVYSGYPGQGDARNVSTKDLTYLRGTQLTDRDGVATFRTVYPGWYPGRTPHIHVKVFLGNRTVLTGQAYFPDDVSARIYRDQAPYNSRPNADTTNATDFIFKSRARDGGGIVLAIGEKAGLMTAALAIAIDRTGEAARPHSRRGWLGGILGRNA